MSMSMSSPFHAQTQTSTPISISFSGAAGAGTAAGAGAASSTSTSEKRKSDDDLSSDIEARTEELRVQRQEQALPATELFLLSRPQRKQHYIQKTARKRTRRLPGFHYCCSCDAYCRIDLYAEGGLCVACEHHRCAECLVPRTDGEREKEWERERELGVVEEESSP